jgi:hypothetical protein
MIAIAMNQRAEDLLTVVPPVLGTVLTAASQEQFCVYYFV